MRWKKPSAGGRKDSFALACFQLISGQQSDATGVCIPRSSSAARLAKRDFLSSRPAASAVNAGWAAEQNPWRGFCSSFIRVRAGKNESQHKPGVGLLIFFPGGLGKINGVLGAGSTGGRAHGNI